MSNNTITEKEDEPNSSQNEDQTKANGSPDIQNIVKTDAVLSVIENSPPVKEVIVNINNVTDASLGKNGESKKYSVFGYDQNRPPTWVMFQGRMQPLPPDSTPLSYDSSRNGFIRLVLSIVLIMILVTAAFVAFVMFHSGTNAVFKQYGLMIAIPAMILMIALNYAIACSQCSRTFPCNIVILVLATICMSLICGYVTCRYKTQLVLYAVLATSIVVMVCILLAFSRFDFTKWMLYIVIISAAFGAITMIVMVAMLLTGTYMKVVHLVILVVGTVIQCVVLTMELQMILGGRAVEIGEDDYALAAFMLYTSIVDLFLKLLMMLGIVDDL